MPTIPLTKGQRSRVDWRDYKSLMRHDWPALWKPRARQVDHKNHDTLDNRRANLRVVTHRGNAENRRDQSQAGVGVARTRGGRFQAHARSNGALHYIGTFDSAEEARKARKTFLRKGGKAK